MKMSMVACKLLCQICPHLTRLRLYISDTDLDHAPPVRNLGEAVAKDHRTVKLCRRQCQEADAQGRTY